MSWLPIARTLAPFDGWKVAGEVEEVPAVVVGEPEAEAVAARVVLFPTGYGAGATVGVFTGVVTTEELGVEEGVEAAVLLPVLLVVVEERDALPEAMPPTHWMTWR